MLQPGCPKLPPLEIYPLLSFFRDTSKYVLNTRFDCLLYMYGTRINSKSMDQPGKIANNPARAELKKGN